MKRVLYRITLRCLTVCLLCGASPCRAVTASRPNIVFLLTDDQTALAAGCYGNGVIHTPNFDRLAREGVRFDNHYASTSICMASRCSIMTGLYEYRHGCNFEHGDLERRRFLRSYPVMLREAGYYTGFAGKVGFKLQGEKFQALETFFDGWAGGPNQTYYETAGNAGIAKYADQYPHCSRAYGAWATDFLCAAKASRKPFCLSVSFKAPHLPFTPDLIDMDLYRDTTFPKPVNYGVANVEQLAPHVRTSRAFQSYRFWVKDYDNSLAKYYQLIAGVDAALAMIREALDREGLADNTVIIFTSDNGYSCGAHGLGDKILPYEEASKSPLVIYDPRLPKNLAGKVSEAVTANVDMAPTILELAGVPIPPDIDGTSVLPLLTNPAGKVRDYVPLFNFYGIPSAQTMAVVTSEWKYIYWWYGGKGLKPVEELFHVGKDRFEMKNVADQSENAAQLHAMRRLYDRQLDHLTRHLAQNHFYEPYPALFSRSLSWEEKAKHLNTEDWRQRESATTTK